MHISMVTWIVIVAAIVVGCGIGVYLGKKKNKAFGEKKLEQAMDRSALKKEENTWNELMKSQKSLDQLKIADILDWANNYKNELKKDDSYFLFKATKANIEKLGFMYPEQIDSETNVLACVINTESGNVSHVQLFTFGTISDHVMELFAGFDYAVITL
ncbi:MAG: hypothetical protein Q4C66_06295 [Lachnospiraceae bacterium]|nr:hypothetical protein [Lachnospiraceae bacterium]